MLHVDRREHVDAGGQHVAHVFVALLVLDARRVGVRELVDQAQLRRARDDRRQIQLLQLGVPIAHAPARHQLEALGLGDRFDPPVRL